MRDQFIMIQSALSTALSTALSALSTLAQKTVNLFDATMSKMALLVVFYGGFILYGSILAIAQIPSSPSPAPLYDRDRVDIEHRLSVMESVQKDLESQFFWSHLGTGGTGLLLIERAMRLLRRKEV